MHTLFDLLLLHSSCSPYSLAYSIGLNVNRACLSTTLCLPFDCIIFLFFHWDVVEKWIDVRIHIKKSSTLTTMCNIHSAVLWIFFAAMWIVILIFFRWSIHESRDDPSALRFDRICRWRSSWCYRWSGSDYCAGHLFCWLRWCRRQCSRCRCHQGCFARCEKILHETPEKEWLGSPHKWCQDEETEEGDEAEKDSRDKSVSPVSPPDTSNYSDQGRTSLTNHTYLNTHIANGTRVTMAPVERSSSCTTSSLQMVAGWR